MRYIDELNKIDTEEKAYLLGFLYGDGTISTYITNNKRRYETRISIQIDDNQLIEILQKTFPFFIIGSYDFSKHNPNSKKQVSISNNNKKLYDDLLLNGLFPRKSYENKDNLHIPDIDPKLISHFIRGFFDADGSIFIPKFRPNLRMIEFCSVSKTFITELDLYLKNSNINSWKVREKMPRGKSKQILYVLTFIKTIEVLKLINYMYDNANIFLERKAKICKDFKPVNKVLDRNLNCPSCSSNNVTKNGKRGNSLRFKCSNCNKGFSIKTII